MAQGSMNRDAVANSKPSQIHSIPPPPSVAGFTFETIGRQPQLLNRLGDGFSGQNGAAQYNFSPSPSPNLEEQLLPSESSGGDSDAQQHPPTRRNRLLEALAPGFNVDTNDTHVAHDDVNRPTIGANAGSEATPSSTTFSRPHSGSTSQLSHEQSFRTRLTALSQSASGSTHDDVANRTSGNAAHTVKTGSVLGNTSTTSIHPAQLPRNHPSVPPTPPPEADGSASSTVPKAVTHYDALRAAHDRLQTLLDTGFDDAEDFNAIRELAQVAKVESTSVSLASQKSVSLAQKALALAQESMSASQECVNISHAAKSHWEAAIQGCEQFMEQRSTKVKQQQDAFRKELSALGESIKSLEEADRKRTARWESQRKAMVEEQARRAAAAAKAPPPTPSSSTAAGPSHNVTSVPIPATHPAAVNAEQQGNAARQYVLADEFESLRREVENLRKLAHGRTGKDAEDRGKEADVEQRQQDEQKRHSQSMKLETEYKPSLSQPQQLALSQSSQSSHALPVPPLPHRPRVSQQPAPQLETAADPRVREQALKEKLKSHRKPSVGALDSSVASSGSHTPSAILPNGHMRSQSQQSQHNRTASSSVLSQAQPEPAKAGAVQIKAEDKEVEVPPAPSQTTVPPLPSRKPPSTAPAHLEYPPSTTTPTAPLPVYRRPSNPPPIRIPQRGIVESPRKDLDASDSEESPIHIHRQGSDPGNLPILFPNSILLETFPESGASESSLWSQIPAGSTNALPPQAARQPAHAPPCNDIPQSQSVMYPPIATLSAGPSSANSSTATTAPPLPDADRQPLKRSRQKGNAHRVTSSMPSVPRPPSSAQLPPKPTTGPPPPQARRDSQSVQTQSGSVAPSPVEPMPVLVQQPQAPGPRVRRSGSDPRRPPPSSRPPIADSDRTYVPPRSPSPPPLERRSRSAERRSRNDRLPPRGDHYSPHGRNRSPRRDPLPRPRSRTPVRSIAAKRVGEEHYPPPPPRRVMQPHRRAQSPARDVPPHAPPPPVAGTKRPFEDTNASAAPAPVRRRVEERQVDQQPSLLAASLPPEPPSYPGGPLSPHQAWTEEWSCNAEYSGSPASATRPTLGAPVALTKRQTQHQAAHADQGPAKLSSRLSDARTVAERSVPVHQMSKQAQIQRSRSRSSPTSRYNSPALEASPSAPSLLQRFGEQASPRSAAPGSRGRGGHRGGRGRAGGSGGGQSHQAHNNRMSSGHGGPVSLLQRIHQ